MTTSSTQKNISYNMIYQTLIILLPFLTAPYLSRVIGSVGVGVYSYTYSIAHYFALFSVMGLVNYGNRTIAQNRDNHNILSEKFCEIYTMQLIFSGISLAIYLVVILFCDLEYRSILLIQTICVLSAGLDISWFFYGIEQFKMMVVRNTIVKITTTLCIFIFIKTENDLWKYTFIMAMGMLVSQFCLWTRLTHYVQIQHPRWCNIYRHIKPNIILFIPVVAVSLYRIMDKIMLGAISTMEQTGIYENSDRLVALPLTIVSSIGIVMMPKMANIYANNKDDSSKILIRNSMQFVIAIASAMAFGMAAIAKVFVPIYYGNEFIECGSLIMMMSPILLFESIAGVVRSQYLIPKEKDKIYIISVISGAVINLIINAIYIPRLGATGAAIGTIVAGFTVMFVQCFCVRKELDFSLYIRDSWIFIMVGGIMFFFLHEIQKCISPTLLNVFIQVFLGICIYSILSVIVMFIVDRDRFFYIKSYIKITKV